MIKLPSLSASPQFLGLAALLTLAGAAPHAAAQGCVAGRCPVTPTPHLSFAGADLGDRPFAGLQAFVGYRWLRSDRHFIGTDEQEERQRQGSEVINELSSYDLGMQYSFTPRFSLSLDVPFVENDRSSPIYLENNRELPVVGRWDSHANGLGDIRLSFNAWLWNPAGEVAPAAPTGKGAAAARPAASVAGKGNVRLGIGVDAPTGEKDVMTRRKTYKNGDIVSDPETRAADQSIQPGDGGWGIPLDLYGYYNFTERLSGYVQGSYLVTPETDNGVATLRSNPFESVMSIGDTFLIRSGVEWLVSPAAGLTVGLGLRSEGQPVRDLVGSSDGFRRPGMNIAVEPSVSWMKHGWSASLSVPVVFYNERFQSVPDKQWQAATGVPRHGDAAFADYYVMLSIGKQF